MSSNAAVIGYVVVDNSQGGVSHGEPHATRAAAVAAAAMLNKVKRTTRYAVRAITAE